MSLHDNPSQLDAEAAEWLIELRDPEHDILEADAKLAEREAAFLEWLALSPQHLQAFEKASRTFDALDKLRALDGIDVQQLIKGHSNDVIPLYPMHSAQRRRRPARHALAVAAAVSALAVGVAILWAQSRSHSYATVVGEQRTVRLDDGSVIHLNTDSQVAVHFNEQTRAVTLVAGEALFEVSHDSSRPFIVSTGAATIRDLGTKFDVYRRAAAQTTVSVVEGAVQVMAGDAAPSGALREGKPTQLDAGEEANISGGLIVKKSKPDVIRAVAWRDRTLSFSGASLAEVATEFNRYNKVQIRIEGAAVRERQLSGVFSADHPQSVILFLAKDASLAVVPDGDSWIISAR